MRGGSGDKSAAGTGPRRPISLMTPPATRAPGRYAKPSAASGTQYDSLRRPAAIRRRETEHAQGALQGEEGERDRSDAKGDLGGAARRHATTLARTRRSTRRCGPASAPLRLRCRSANPSLPRNSTRRHRSAPLTGSDACAAPPRRQREIRRCCTSTCETLRSGSPRPGVDAGDRRRRRARDHRSVRRFGALLGRLRQRYGRRLRATRSARPICSAGPPPSTRTAC